MILGRSTDTSGLTQVAHLAHMKKENVIYFDLVVSEDRYKTLSKSKQRYVLSHEFYAFLSEKIQKYKIEHLKSE